MRPFTVLPALALAGCGSFATFTDDVDLELDFFTLFEEGSVLHTPYVEGAQVMVFVRASRRLEGWTVRSTAPDVFTVGGLSLDQEDLDAFTVTGHAAGAGLAALELVDPGGEVRDSAEIDVRAPDGFELHAAAPLFVGLPESDSRADEVLVLAGGLATFQVRWFEGEQELLGNGALAAAAADPLTVSTERTYLFENRDWLRVAPSEPGPLEIEISAGGRVVDVLAVEAVGEDAIDHVELVGRPETGAEEGDGFVLMAQAFTVDDRPIYGVEYDWERDGFAEPGLGDLYRYGFDPAAESRVRAQRGDQGAEVTIHGDGWVDSSNDLGCAHAPGLHGGIAALGLLVLRRRRAAIG